MSQLPINNAEAKSMILFELPSDFPEVERRGGVDQKAAAAAFAYLLSGANCGDNTNN